MKVKSENTVPKWWTHSFEKMESPLEKLQYLTGLSDLSWSDCQDAWFESMKLIPEVAGELADCHEIYDRISKELGGAGVLITESIYDGVTSVINQRDDLRAAVATLFNTIKHGDDAHQTWLREALASHFRGLI